MTGSRFDHGGKAEPDVGVIERSVRSWREFVELAESQEFDGWAFRGQRKAAWPLYASLPRYLRRHVPDQGLWGAREKRGIRIFRRKAHHFLPDPGALEDDLRCLALMQHHGAPTRLLDFTKSPYVAAFFALEGAMGDAAVWAVNTPVLYEAAPKGGSNLTRDRVDPRRPGGFEEYYLSNSRPFAWAGEPQQMDRRLIAQSGTFLLPGILSEPLEGILRHYAHPRPLLAKLILPADRLRTESLKALYRMNITPASLFPDLDGLARSIAYELELAWRESTTDAGPADPAS